MSTGKTFFSLTSLAVAILSFAATVPLAAQGAGETNIRFEEIGEKAGMRFVHSTRKFGERHKAEVLEMFTDGGSGAAVGDYNNDGFEDVFVADSDQGKLSHLMRNNGDLTFTDVAVEAGVAEGNETLQIVADAMWLDYDNDGQLDLLVGRFGTPLLYRNLGPDKDGKHKFDNVSEAVGLTQFGNTIAMIAFDFDRDGYLDILLGNYFQPLNLLDLKTKKVLPNNLDNATNGGGVTFWRSVASKDKRTGGRAFVEITEKAGFSHHTGWSLDLGHADLDNDGWQDVYIAGDYGTDRVFFNQGDGTFKDVTEEANGGFDTRKGMNVDMGDYNRDGFLDVYVTNITDEYMKECNMMWHNNGDGTMIDLSKETGTCDTDWGWAAKFGDYDNDGWEDLFVVNGLRSAGEANFIPLLLDTTIIKPGVDFSDVDSYPDIGDMTWSGYQKQRLFQNLADGTFKEVGAGAGVDNDLDGRGVAVGDLDNDGRLDFYQTNANQPALLYHNVTPSAGNWVALKLIGKTSNRDAIGARVTLTVDGETWLREVNGGNGYSSSSTTRLHIGLGSAKKISKVEIRWPNGKIETLEGKDGRSPIPLGALSYIEEGKGVVRR